MNTSTPNDIADRHERHRYELNVDGKLAAHVNYKLLDGAIDLIHTEVEPGHEGQGLASRIAKFALDDARSRGLKVIPSCSYISTYIERHPSYADLVTQR